MASIWMTFVPMSVSIVLMGCLTAQARVSEPRLTFNEGFYTFSEIATQLSTTGQTFRVEPALKQRAAFLSVHHQPLSQLKEALSDALGVRFRWVSPQNNQPGYWLMEADPERKREDRLLMRKLADAVCRKVQTQLTIKQRFYTALWGGLEWAEVERSI